jgi:hypothetical protein
MIQRLEPGLLMEFPVPSAIVLFQRIIRPVQPQSIELPVYVRTVIVRLFMSGKPVVIGNQVWNVLIATANIQLL